MERTLRSEPRGATPVESANVPVCAQSPAVDHGSMIASGNDEAFECGHPLKASTLSARQYEEKAAQLTSRKEIDGGWGIPRQGAVGTPHQCPRAHSGSMH